MSEKKEMTTKISRNLMVELSEDEKKKYGRNLANLLYDKGQIEAEKKAAMDGFKEKLSSLEVDAGKLASAIRDGAEHRDVECEWVFHWDSLTKTLTRTDTGEIIETDMIGPDDRQIGLDGIDNN